MNGLVRRSWPMVLVGPCPQMKAKSSPSGSTLVRIEFISASWLPIGRSVRPTDPWNSTSPISANRCGAIDQHHRARRMPRAMQHLERMPGDRHRIAVGEPAIGRHRARLDAVGRPCLSRLSSSGRSASCGPSIGNAAEPLAHLRRPAGVVDVPVRQQDLLRLHAHLGDRRLDAVEIAAGIDHGAHHRLGVPDQRAVLLEGRHRHDGRLEALGGRAARFFAVCHIAGLAFSV